MKNGFTIHISQIPIQFELDNMMCRHTVKEFLTTVISYKVEKLNLSARFFGA
jgi:hypothetical protein